MAKRIIDLGVTKEMLTGDNFPEIKIADKCYVVDDRQSTWDKIQEAQNNEKLSPKEKEDKIYLCNSFAESGTVQSKVENWGSTEIF